MDVYSTISTRTTPQTERADTRQVPNSAGGHTFTVDDETRLRRFLVLGSEGGTYYTGERDLTLDNAQVVLRMAQANPARLVEVVREISTAGRAPKPGPALFALAIAASHPDQAGRAAAWDALPDIARTGTHLLTFVRYLRLHRGWGRAAKRAVGAWYTAKPVDDLAYQVVKYRQREGWSHGDVLRVTHPRADTPQRHGLYRWALGKDAETVPALVEAWTRAQDATTAQALDLIADHALSWEMLPDRLLTEPAVWEALIDKGLPQTALLRQLPRLTRLGLITGARRTAITHQLADPERLKRARVHPISVLVAQRTYASGRSARGESQWTPDRHIIDALDAAFYAAFTTVEPTGKRLMLALDVSGSMATPISGMPITAREATAALALVTAATEDDYDIVGFTGGSRWVGGWGNRPTTASITPLTISPRQRLDDALRYIDGLPFGPTDCAQPMLYALDKNLPIDTFVIYTDNETWAGRMHPHQALLRYREKTGIDARLVVVAMTSTRFTIADPTDPGMLDIAGFDSAVPNLITTFARGL